MEETIETEENLEFKDAATATEESTIAQNEIKIKRYNKFKKIIIEKINTAIKNGEYAVTIGNNMPEELKEELSNLGYKIKILDDLYFLEENVYEISWRK